MYQCFDVLTGAQGAQSIRASVSAPVIPSGNVKKDVRATGAPSVPMTIPAMGASITLIGGGHECAAKMCFPLAFVATAGESCQACNDALYLC